MQARFFPSLDAAATDVSVGGKHDDISQNTMNPSHNSLTHYLTVTLFLLILGLGSPAVTAQEETSSGNIQEMMSPEEFRAAGLNKLSPEERQKLDAWLQGYRETTEKTTEKKVAARTARTKLDTLLSRVDGSFSGLRGHTLIKLEDGTVWKQANSDDHYGASPIENPGAMVVHTGFGYKMRIQGVPEFYVNPAPTH
jgi:hypothetical protein